MRDSKTEILEFWFNDIEPSLWFQRNPEFDQSIRDRFLNIYDMAVSGLCDGWAASAEGALALCVLLDQFPRNMFRGDAKAFATDEKARIVAAAAIRQGFDMLLDPARRRFLYLPFEHSEDMADQRHSVALFAGMKKDDPLAYDYALRHLDVIERFGRFPYRNAVLGRESTQEEREWLEQGGGF